MSRVRERDIEYICRDMLGIGWQPYRDRDVWLTVLQACGSKLEMMYLLGVGYYLNSHCRESFGCDNPLYPDVSLCFTKGGQPGICFTEPWHGCPDGMGPSALLVVPQWRSPEREIRHDFGLFTSDDNSGAEPWHLGCAVEIDGYGIHRGRRGMDAVRDAALSYRVLRFYEETSSPLDWLAWIAKELEWAGPEAPEGAENDVPF